MTSPQQRGTHRDPDTEPPAGSVRVWAAAVASSVREHLTSTASGTGQHVRRQHLSPRQAAIAVGGLIALILAAAVTFWLTNPAGSHRTLDDPAVAALRTYEAALDVPQGAAAADVSLELTTTQYPDATHVGAVSPVTGTCWVLTIPTDTTQPTSLAAGGAIDCGNTDAKPSTPASPDGTPATSTPTSAPVEPEASPALQRTADPGHRGVTAPTRPRH